MQNMQQQWIRREGSRLAYYRLDAPTGPELWDFHWTNQPVGLSFYHRYEDGHVAPYEPAFSRYLPKSGIVLEAGCGLAGYVVALRARGYDCRGIDFANETVQRVKANFPDLPVESGDVLNLNYDDGEISAYISLGVVEHFQDGPLDALSEAARVLRPGGTLLISVPQFHRWRGLDAHAEGTVVPEGASFYQYAFAPQEFSAYLIERGFVIEAEYGFGVHYALRERFDAFAGALKRVPKLRAIDRLADHTALGLALGRMRMWVATKPDD